jgi:hypothetical protein
MVNEMTGPITGSFIDEITYDIPSSNWTKKEWCRDLDNMKKIGIDTLIFIRGGFYGRTIYPSSHFGTENTDDFAGFIMTEAAKRKMDVFMGLHISTLDWSGGDAKGEIARNRHFLDEVYTRYKGIPSFKGWYIPQEASRDELNITEVMKGLSYLCKEKDSTMPVLISPYFNTYVTGGDFTVEQHAEEWHSIFSRCSEQIDICAFQDGSAPMETMSEYLSATKKLCDEFNIRHWVNTETFERDVRKMYYPIPFDILRQKLDMHKAYAEKVITFEFSHFLSPQSIYPSARNLNRLYRDFYKRNK